MEEKNALHYLHYLHFEGGKVQKCRKCNAKICMGIVRFLYYSAASYRRERDRKRDSISHKGHRAASQAGQ